MLINLTKNSQRRSQICFWLSLILPTYYGIFSLIHALSHAYIVQDDVRQHGFWMARFSDPNLFPNDLIADYFQSVAPLGYRTLYATFAQIGIDPLLLAKLLPLPLALIATAYGYGLALQLFNLPIGALICSIVLTQSLWLQDDIITGVARAFVYPFFLAFLYYLVKRSPLPCIISIALLSLFYPQVALVSIGILVVQLLEWKDGKPSLSSDRSRYWLALLGGGIALALLLIFMPDVGDLGPAVTAEQMRSMPEYSPTGRSRFFHPDPFTYWWSGDSGLSAPTDPPYIWISVLLPVLISRRLPLTERITAKCRILADILLASLGLFTLAHILLFRLHFPNRYTQHGLRVVMAIAAGICITILLNQLLSWATRSPQNTPIKRGAVALVGALTLAAVIIPASPSIFLPLQNQVIGQYPSLYQFFAQQPSSTMVASLAEEASNLPTFSQRSILVGREYSLPYHIGYYSQIRQQAIDLITAHYSPDLVTLQNFIRAYRVNFLLVEPQSFRPDYIQTNNWMMQYQPAANAAIASLTERKIPALRRAIPACTVFRERNLIVLDAACILGGKQL